MAKPTPPQLNMARLREYKILRRERPKVENDLSDLSARLRILEEQRALGEVSTNYLALEALDALSAAIKAGVPDDDARAMWPSDWGDEHMTVPISLMSSLGEAWAAYREGPTGQTLGESFGLEGRGQGRQKMRDTQKTRQRQRDICGKVLASYMVSAYAGQSLSIENAVAEVAKNENISCQTVRDAFNRYRREFEDKARKGGYIHMGLLSWSPRRLRVKTSRSK